MRIIGWIGIVFWAACAFFFVLYWLDETPMHLPMMLSAVLGCFSMIGRFYEDVRA